MFDRKPGATWTASAHAWAATLPQLPHILVGRIVVTSPTISQQVFGPNFTQRAWRVPLGSVELFSSDSTKATSSPR